MGTKIETHTLQVVGQGSYAGVGLGVVGVGHGVVVGVTVIMVVVLRWLCRVTWMWMDRG